MTNTASHMLVDRAQLRQRVLQASSRHPETHPLVARVVDDVADRLAFVLRDFPQAAAIAPMSSSLPDVLRDRPATTHVLDARTAPPADTRAVCHASNAVVIDDEALPFGNGTLDLIVSMFALHSTNDLPGALLQARRALRPDGLFVGVLCAGMTLHELRASFLQAEAERESGASPRVMPFADVRDLGGLMQRAGFALPVADSDTVTVTYETPLHLMHDLRAVGATNTLVGRKRSFTRRDTLLRAAEIYAGKYGETSGRIRATVELVTVTGWAPDPGQQQPLKPGTAKTRLADALDTSEVILDSSDDG